MPIQVKQETLASFKEYYLSPGRKLNWPVLFTLPAWLEAWWAVFGEYRFTPLIRSVWKNEDLIGLAPLMQRGKTAYLIGSSDLCDYLDFIIQEGEEEVFFTALLKALAKEGITTLVLKGQRPEAAVFKGVFAAEKDFAARTFFEPSGVASEVKLSGSFEEYLQSLTKKQRHEVRRKLRRIKEQTLNLRFEVVGGLGQGQAVDDVLNFFPYFMVLFNENPDKNFFMTAERNDFFRVLTQNMAKDGLLRFGFLEINLKLAAAVLYFIYRDRVYLYNSGYLREFAPLSAGLMTKIYCLKESAETGLEVFDFLKGPEAYKARLGGRPVSIYTVTIELGPGPFATAADGRLV